MSFERLDKEAPPIIYIGDKRKRKITSEEITIDEIKKQQAAGDRRKRYQGSAKDRHPGLPMHHMRLLREDHKLLDLCPRKDAQNRMGRFVHERS